MGILSDLGNFSGHSLPANGQAAPPRSVSVRLWAVAWLAGSSGTVTKAH